MKDDIITEKRQFDENGHSNNKSHSYKMVAVYMAQIYGTLQCEIRHELDLVAKERGIKLVYFTNFSDSYTKLYYTDFNTYDIGEQAIFHLADPKAFDGVITMFDDFAKQQYPNILKLLHDEYDCPVVNIRTREEGFYNILFDDDASFTDMVKHLINEHNCREFFLVTGPKDIVHSLKRKESYERALDEYGLEYNEDKVFYGNFWKNCGDDAVDAVQKYYEGNADRTMPDAIVCANDYMALAVIEALSNRGIRVPQDIKVTGYDNVVDGKNYYPSVTTVSLPIQRLGGVVYDTLEKAWREGNKPEDIYMKEELIFRQSCGCMELTKQPSIQVTEIKNDLNQKMEYTVHATTYMIMNLSATNDPKEFYDIVARCSTDNTGFGNFALCIASDWEQRPNRILCEEENADEEMTAVVCVRNGVQELPQRFMRRQMLPDSFLEDITPHYILPLHYMQYYIGYLVVSIQDDKMDKYTIKAWILHLACALENLRVHRRLNETVTELESLYNHDLLTGLYNRHGYEFYANQYFGECMQMHENYLVMQLDMDGLKDINDTYGHADGDYCITRIGNVLSKAAEHDEICIRTGGDEFVVVGRGYSDARLKELIDRLNREMESVNADSGKPYKIRLSMGWKMAVPQPGETPAVYLDQADEAMYEDKRKHKALSMIDVNV